MGRRDIPPARSWAVAHLPRTAQWTRGAATLACATGICAPIYLAASTAMRWPDKSGNLVITGAHIVDPASNKVIDGQSGYISDGRVVEISQSPVHPGWPRLEAQNRYLVAGLIDVHTHIQSPVDVELSRRQSVRLKEILSL